MRSTMLERSVRYVLFASSLLVLVMAAAGCGGEGDGSAGGAEAAIDAVKQDRPKQPVSEYEEVLLDLRDAAAVGEIYDAYGFAEYMPLSQRAALDAFCFVTESLLDSGEIARFGEPAYVAGKVRARARIEFDHGDPAEIGASEMATARKAIRKLRSIIDYESIDQELAGNYVTACYNRSS